MPIENFDQRIAALSDSFKNAPSDGGGFINELPEPGEYQAVFRYVDFFEQKNPPNAAFLKLAFEIVFDTKYQGREVELIYNLEPHKPAPGKAAPTKEELEMKLGFLKADLKKLGVAVDEDDFTLAQVRPGGSIWDPIMDVPVEISVRDSKKTNPNTGRPYRNAYLNTRTGDPLPKGQQPIPSSDIPVQLGDPVTPQVPVASAMDDDLPPF
jgi:hypothetical protein